MSVKGTVLENYRFDARDFTDGQLRMIMQTCLQSHGFNKELQPKMLRAVEYQHMQKLKYFQRVSRARSEAYSRHIRKRNFDKIGIPESVSSKYDALKEKWKQLVVAAIPEKMSIYTKDGMNWPEINVSEESVAAPHLVASMPPECLKLSGWERVKQAFMPKTYLPYYNPENEVHTYNRETLVIGTMLSAFVGGGYKAYDHAKMDLDAYKKQGHTQLYESKYTVWRAREQVWLRSIYSYGFKWGWRIGFLFSTTYLISQAMTIYKLKDKVSHYMIGASIPAALYKWKLGPSGMLKTGILGALVIGLPIGFMSAVLGYNIRIQRYYNKIEARNTGPLTENGMSHQKVIDSYEKLSAILDLLKSKPSEMINNKDLYRDFVGSE